MAPPPPPARPLDWFAGKLDEAKEAGDALACQAIGAARGAQATRDEAMALHMFDEALKAEAKLAQALARIPVRHIVAPILSHFSITSA